jgi:hypothetical protein
MTNQDVSLIGEGKSEQFEAWAMQAGLISESHGIRFVNSMCDVARKAWQASRRAALEECWEAVHAERLEDPTDLPDDIAYELAVRDCEAAIRGLANGDKNG